ncbi:MAG: SPOR domain-containing protein [Muribaculaceae bacterium]|nr:SPOR domain-containing protein [Muribaculaceae bacterium]MDE6522506.1 SPOR domain-containing protein [Muribaculaceae bacterium]
MTDRIRTYLNKNFRKMLISAIILPGCALPVFADGPEYENIVERIQAESNGNVIIEIDEDLLNKILTDPEVSVRKKESRDLNATRNGYRIQVFSDGRNQSSLEARAKARGNAIVARFPKYRGQVYTFSSAPNWYTRIGNFRNEEEAQKALDELKRSFPSFSSEMRVVKSKINVR